MTLILHDIMGGMSIEEELYAFKKEKEINETKVNLNEFEIEICENHRNEMFMGKLFYGGIKNRAITFCLQQSMKKCINAIYTNLFQHILNLQLEK